MAVLQGFCDGKKQSEIAAELILAVGTVKTYMGHVYIKLELNHLKIGERRRFLFQEVCPALKHIVPPPDDEDESLQMMIIPYEIEQMVDDDERALLAIEPHQAIKVKSPPQSPQFLPPGQRMFTGSWLWTTFFLGIVLTGILGYFLYPRLFPPETQFIVHTTEPDTFIATFVDEVEVTRVHKITTTPQPTSQPQTIMITTTPLPTSPPEQVEVVVVVTATNEPKPTEDLGGAELGSRFEDDFEMGFGSHWEVISGELGMMQGWLTVTKPYNATRTEHFTMLPDVIWKNVVVEIEIEEFDGGNKAHNGAGGIIIGYQEDGSAVVLVYYPSGYGMEFGLLTPEKQLNIIPGTKSDGDYIGNSSSTIKIEVKEDLVYGYINNKLVTFTQVSEPTTGEIGLWFRTSNFHSYINEYAPRIEWIRVETLPEE